MENLSTLIKNVVADYLDSLGVEASKSYEYSPNDTAIKTHTYYEAAKAVREGK